MTDVNFVKCRPSRGYEFVLVIVPLLTGLINLQATASAADLSGTRCMDDRTIGRLQGAHNWSCHLSYICCQVYVRIEEKMKIA